MASLNSGPSPNRPVRIASIEGSAHTPAWLPGGRELLFIDTGRLFRIAAEPAATPGLVPIAGDQLGSLAISRGGRLIYTRQNSSESDVLRVRSTAGMWSKPEPFISSTMLDIEPQFSPDGRHIIYSLNSTVFQEVIQELMDYMHNGARS